MYLFRTLCLCLLTAALLVFLSGAAAAQAYPEISDREFANIVETFSEPGGYFRHDNWISNELSYLTVLEPLERHRVSGGVYIGVGPNQNFTYIANIKPEVAFIVDIRRQNMLQHLVWKVAFERSESRAQFFSFLFSKRLDTSIGPTPSAGLNALVEYFTIAPSDSSLFEENYSIILSTLTGAYGFHLSGADSLSLRGIFRTFYTKNLNMTYSGNRYYWFPTYGAFLRMTDGQGNQKNPMNSREEYLYLRGMHSENRIIPVVGNFGGSAALRKIAEFMEENRLTLSVFYVSNVEQYLMRDYSLWRGWVENVRMLPRSGESVFIRWNYFRRYSSAQTRLQRIDRFLENCDAHRYVSYDDLIYYDYIR